MNMGAIRILGVDPGLRNTGWGVIEVAGSRLGYVSCGSIHTDAATSLAERLALIHRALARLVEDERPAEAAVEETFVNRDPQSTLKLGQARGVALNAVQTDALAWEWPGEAYDVVALIFLHLVADERRALHARVVGALKPGGLVILEAFRPEQLARQAAGARGGPRVRELLYALDDLEADFAALNTIELGEADADFDEGTLHVGLSAVVRATMRRP